MQQASSLIVNCPTSTRGRVLQSLVDKHRKILIFTSPAMVAAIVAKLESAGIPAVSFRQMYREPLDKFSTLDRGVLVSTPFMYSGWRCDADVIAFVEVHLYPGSDKYRQCLTRIREPKPPYFINCVVHPATDYPAHG